MSIETPGRPEVYFCQLRLNNLDEALQTNQPHWQVGLTDLDPQICGLTSSEPHISTQRVSLNVTQHRATPAVVSAQREREAVL